MTKRADVHLDLDDARARASAAAEPGPTLAALEEARAGPMRRRALSPLSVLSNWRLSRRYRLRLLEEAELHDDVPAGRAPRCEACRDSCCKGPGTAVRLRLSDVARLLDAGLEDAIVPGSPPGEEREPGLVELERLDGQRRFPTLARRQGACVFLDDDDRCAIHPIRPLACRAYPFLVDPVRGRVRWASGCRSLRDDGTSEERVESLRAASGAYNEKVRDLAALVHGRPELERLGISRHLPVVK